MKSNVWPLAATDNGPVNQRLKVDSSYEYPNHNAWNVLTHLFAGKDLYVRGFAEDVADEKIKKFFGKKGVAVAHVKRVKGKQ